MSKHSSVGEICLNRVDAALKIAPLIGMTIMVHSDDSVSVTTINSIKVNSNSIVLYTGIGLVTIMDNTKMREVLVINSKGHVETLYSLISDVVYL